MAKEKLSLTGNIWKISTVVMLFIFGLSLVGVFRPISASIAGMFVAPAAEPENVALTIITDSECSLCDYSTGLQYFQTNVPDLETKTVSYQGAEGRNLVKSLGIDAVPAFIFNSAITDSDIYSQIGSYFTKRGDYYEIQPIWIQRTVDPDLPDTQIKLVTQSSTLSDAESAVLYATYQMVTNAKLVKLSPSSADGSSILSTYSASAPVFVMPEGTISADDMAAVDELLINLEGTVSDCKKTVSSAELKTEGGFDILSITEELADAYTKSEVPKLEFFVMSFCPYGNTAEDALKPVYDLFGEKALIEPHYIVGSSTTGYSSLHGAQELNQDVRELCVWNYYDHATWWAFVDDVNAGCTSQNADTCWEQYATSNGIDAGEIETCQSAEIESLLDPEVALTTYYGITGSPTFMINGEKYTGGRTSDAIKEALCCAFEDEPAECSQVI